MRNRYVLEEILDDARETGLIEDYTHCPGTNTFDVWINDNHIVQITIEGD